MPATNTTLQWLGALSLISIFTLAAGDGHAAQEQRGIRAVGGFETEKSQGGRRDLTQTPALAATTTKGSPAAAAPGGETSRTHSASCCTHYVYDGYTELLDDFDYDGFYSFLKINIDIDTDYVESDLYLDAYLRDAFGDWHRIYTSEVFTIAGTSAFDDYEIEAELVSGFPADRYDLIVEVYDALSGEMVVDYGPPDNPSFSQLPLEDVNRDGALAPPIVNSYGSSGGGSVSLAVVLFLLGLALVRARGSARYSAD